jgi:uncharacterized protein YaaR (DUF327 family)
LEIKKDIFLGRMDIIKNETLNLKQNVQEKTERFEGILKETSIAKVDKVRTLEEWVRTLEELKQRLDNDTSRDNLATYKDSIKRFLDYYVRNEMYLKEHQTQDGMFYSKKIQVIKSKDEQIDQMTERLMKTQAGKLEILRMTGEIQGLLFELIV